MSFADMSLKEFNNELASSKPTPGGGSVAGLSAALSAALTAMVISLTKDESLNQFSKKIDDHIRSALQLIDQDAASFNKVMKAYKMSKGNQTEIKNRKKAIQDALYEASLTPLETIKLANSILKISKEVAVKGNQNAISDAGVAGLMALASIKGAAYNVYINISSLNDKDKAENLKKETEELINESEVIANEIEEITMNKIS